MLDFESNKIKDLDQLFYLRRNKKLTHLNLKFNPVAYGESIGSSHGPSASRDLKITDYYERIRDCCPNIVELDDEDVDGDFFSSKIKAVNTIDTFQNIRPGIDHLDFFKRFVQMTLQADQIHELTANKIKEIDMEETEELLLLTTIKN